MLGVGQLPLPLPNIDEKLKADAVFVPNSPFNIIPPQLLYKELEAAGYNPKWPTHNDKEYIFEYTRPGETQATEFVVPINDRDLFTFRSVTGCEDFCMSTTLCDCDLSIETNTKGARYKKFDISASEGAQSNPLTSSPFSESEPRAITFDKLHVSEGAQTYDPEVEIVRHRLFILHEKYGHLGFAKLNLMARAGLIPRELANVDAPTCPGCACGKAHRKPWRYKGTNKRQIKPATHPGQVISVDKLASPTPGFVPTHRGTLTTMRYTGATVFVDHFSDFTYIHLMTEMNAETAVLAKLAFKRECATHGVPVRHYHADNGLFDTKLF
ncbi:unnamed protein product [Cylindrotheca closterium]|uniref:Integrase catalytic domain-containing protein n=1 Tax=Cylindrotheca closterium TaxID=2856 RepID=A0AAD2FV05_9STRA|nr:unnamed protein product [Cylindrotheca closterium]